MKYDKDNPPTTPQERAEANWEGKQRAGYTHGCCALAKQKFCVCARYWVCEVHGGFHIGTHD